MSRSYRKHPILKNVNKVNKRYSNRVTRRKLNSMTDVSNETASHKKMYDSFLISDMKIGYLSTQSWLNEQQDYYDSKYDCVNDYKRYWVSK